MPNNIYSYTKPLVLFGRMEANEGTADDGKGGERTRNGECRHDTDRGRTGTTSGAKSDRGAPDGA
jgi:hypothetical protein